MILHFDVDSELRKYLKTGTTVDYSLTEKTVLKVPQKNSISVISIKSQSTITGKILEALPDLKRIITRTVGTDHIDLAACKQKGIEVKNIPDYGAHNVAEHTMALILAGARNIINAHAEVHKGNFSYQQFLGTALKGKTIGIIGTGAIGLEVAKLSKAFGMNVIAHDIYEKKQLSVINGFQYVSLDFLLKNADIISIHVPSLPGTKYLINDAAISIMKKGIILVNTSRGAVIDEKALICQIKKFKAVCLDVLEDEQSFSIQHPLLQFDNVIITPHIAFFTDSSVKKIAQETEKLVQ